MDVDWHKGWYSVKLDFMVRSQIGAVLANDYHGAKIRNFISAHRIATLERNPTTRYRAASCNQKAPCGRR